MRDPGSGTGSRAVIDKGIPTAGLLAQVLVAKYADHMPLYRQESIFARAGVALPRSTLAEWGGACGVQLQPLVDALKDEMLRHSVLHADETPVAMLAPGKKTTHVPTSGRTARACSKTSRLSSMTSHPAARENTLVRSCSRTTSHGAASWCAMTLVATRPVSRRA